MNLFIAITESDQDLTIEPGEKLEVLREIPKGQATKQKFMAFRNQNGSELKLPFDCAPRFTPLLAMNKTVFAEAVHGRKLPIYVNFATSNEVAVMVSKEQNLSRYGVIQLTKIFEDKLIVASCGHQSVRVIFTIPKQTDVTVKVALGTLINDPVYAGLCKEYNNYKRIETLAIRRHEKDIYRTSGEVRGYEYFLNSIEGGEFVGLENDDLEDDTQVQQNSDTYMANDCSTLPPPSRSLSRKILPYEITDICLDDFKDGGKYCQHLKSKNQELNSQMTLERSGSYDLTVEKSYQSNGQTEPVALINVRSLSEDDRLLSMHDNTNVTDAKTPEIELEDKDGYLVAICAQNDTSKLPIVGHMPMLTTSTSMSTKVAAPPTGTIESSFRIPVNIEPLSTDDVCQCLHKLNLGRLEEVFRKNQINGQLLVSLELEDYKDLKLSNFEAKKVIKFATGWRPDQC